MTRRIFTACMWFLIAFGIVIGLLSIAAELERRDEVQLREMAAKRRAGELARIYGELDAKGRYYTSFDVITKGK